MAHTRVSEFGDVPLLYDRDPAENYGKRGYRVRPYADAVFAAQADSVFDEMFQTLEALNIGQVSAILFGGIGRSGNGSSLHHQNRAFDLDGLIFDSGFIWVADTFEKQPHHYLAIEGVLRQSFGTVLTYGYNAAHRDHIHFDNGDSVGFRRHSKSRVLFLQNALRFLFDQVLDVDGVWGPETQAAERLVRRELGLGSLSTNSNWIGFIETSIDIAVDRAREVDQKGLVA
ncbi:extensin family protein [Ruegeria sp. HKCCD8929]|uniref:extensin family protein n=1 Tax=Ruegeria sp. HKCCD8929 TaxID=2683006 RepID=UPI001489C41F|nr:extensin family protein [Ruegeria sp. HKCCD8929]